MKSTRSIPTVYIKLKRITLRGANSPLYVVEQLRNAAQISVGSRSFRVGDEVTPEQADQLCEERHYEDTINNS